MNTWKLSFCFKAAEVVNAFGKNAQIPPNRQTTHPETCFNDSDSGSTCQLYHHVNYTMAFCGKEVNA